MRTCFLKILAVLLTILLVLTLFACSNQKEDDDSWMNGEISVKDDSNYARQQQFEEDATDGESDYRIDLPTVSLD